MATLVSKTELAQRAGVTKAAITKACVKAFPSALIGPRVNLDHPDVQRYLANRRGAPTSNADSERELASEPTALRPAASPASSPPSMPPGSAHDAHRDTKPEDIEQYAHLSLDALTRKFGTATAFGDWLDARKRISDIREKDLKNDERAGRLIPREFVRTHVFSHIEAANRRLLQDAAATIARRLYAAAKSGTPVEEAEQTVRDIISSQLRPAKETAARSLRGSPEAGSAQVPSMLSKA